MAGERIQRTEPMDSRRDDSRLSRTPLDGAPCGDGNRANRLCDRQQNSSFYWLIDQSAGAPANFDNALQYTNVGGIYKCP